MKNIGPHKGLKTLLIKRLAFIMAVFYMLSPFQQQISTAVHGIFHDLGLPDYVMTHTSQDADENLVTHQYGEHRTSQIVHEHQIIDFIQNLLQDSSNSSEQSDPLLPNKSIDMHLVILSYSLAKENIFEQNINSVSPEQNVRNGHPQLWLEPPIL